MCIIHRGIFYMLLPYSMFLSVGDLFQEYSQRKFNMYTDMHIIFCVVPENTFAKDFLFLV